MIYHNVPQLVDIHRVESSIFLFHIFFSLHYFYIIFFFQTMASLKINNESQILNELHALRHKERPLTYVRMRFDKDGLSFLDSGSGNFETLKAGLPNDQILFIVYEVVQAEDQYSESNVKFVLITWV